MPELTPEQKQAQSEKLKELTTKRDTAISELEKAYKKVKKEDRNPIKHNQEILALYKKYAEDITDLNLSEKEQEKNKKAIQKINRNISDLQIKEIKEKLKEAKDSEKPRLQSELTKLQEARKDNKDDIYGKTFVESMTSKVRENPYKSAAAVSTIAAAIAAVIYYFPLLSSIFNS